MRNWSFMQWVIAVILVCATFGILLIALPAMGIAVPAFVVQILWIVGVAVVAIGAIYFIWRMWSGWGSGGPP